MPIIFIFFENILIKIKVAIEYPTNAFLMKLKFLNLTNLFILVTILIACYVTASIISPYLQYSYQQIGFLTGIEFLKSFSSYPGGIADYLATYVSQFFSFNSTGSIFIVAVASVQGLLVLSILKNLAGELKLRYSAFAIILLFGVLVLCDYRYPYYASIRLLLAYIFTWAFFAMNSRWPRLSTLLWPLMACLLFYLANGAALFVFALASTLIFIATNKERIWLLAIPFFLILAGLIPYIGYKFLFQMTFRNIYGITMVKPPIQFAYTEGIPLYINYGLLPVILLVVLVYLQFRKPEPIIEPTAKLKKGAKVSTKIGFYKKTPFLVSIQVIAFGLLGYLLIGKFHDSFNKQVIKIEYLAENEKWNDVLKEAESIDLYDFRVNFQINRAFAHLGRLPDRLCAYPQRLGPYGLFCDPSEVMGSANMPISDLYFDLGFMDESQHWAFEAETLIPNSPRILKRLVMINLVNRKYQVAGVFLNILGKNRLCHDWVNKYEKYLADTTLAANDKVIAEKRRYTPKKALVNAETIVGLKLLFETNQDNRMAYDYLLAYLILDSRLPEFIHYLKNYTHYNFKHLPRSWEEALALFILKTKTFPDFYTEETISKDCMQRMRNFDKVIKSYNNDLPSAKSTLQRDFGETYWYYSLYLSPKVTNVLNSKTPVR